jgi:hypothetical protein
MQEGPHPEWPFQCGPSAGYCRSDGVSFTSSVSEVSPGWVAFDGHAERCTSVVTSVKFLFLPSTTVTHSFVLSAEATPVKPKTKNTAEMAAKTILRINSLTSSQLLEVRSLALSSPDHLSKSSPEICTPGLSSSVDEEPLLRVQGTRGSDLPIPTASGAS